MHIQTGSMYDDIYGQSMCAMLISVDKMMSPDRWGECICKRNMYADKGYH